MAVPLSFFQSPEGAIEARHEAFEPLLGRAFGATKVVFMNANRGLASPARLVRRCLAKRIVPRFVTSFPL